jgi:hypothetical protein
LKNPAKITSNKGQKPMILKDEKNYDIVVTKPNPLIGINEENKYPVGCTIENVTYNEYIEAFVYRLDSFFFKEDFVKAIKEY